MESAATVQPTSLAARVVDRRDHGDGCHVLSLEAPSIARAFLPGHFVGLKCGPVWSTDPLLRRPFSIMRATPGRETECIDVLVGVVGRGTRALAETSPGDSVELVGPLGVPWSDPRYGLLENPEGLVAVAGGVGIAPFFALAPWLAARGHRLHLLYGARSRQRLVGVADLEAVGARVEVATEDGSVGFHGRVTALLDQVLARPSSPNPLVLVCGPEPMMEATARVAAAHHAECQASLENDMPCGIGACYGCVVWARAKDGRGRFARACIEGPVFDARALGWMGE